MTKTWIILFLIIGVAVGDHEGIRDGDVGSGPLVDYIPDEDAIAGVISGIEKAQTVSSVVKVAANPPTFNLRNAVLGTLVTYTDSKGGIIATMTAALENIRKVIDKMAKRVDLWRKTKPTMLAYKQAASRLLDDTQDLLQDFTWSGFFDPKREWDKRREQLFDANKDGSNWRGAYISLYRSYTGYMASFLSDPNSAQYGEDYRKTRARIVPPIEMELVDNLVDHEGRFDQQKVGRLEDRMVPYNTLVYSADALFTLKEIEADYLRPHENGDKTVQQATLERISTWIGKPEQTMADSRELSAYIAAEREAVRNHIARAGQLQTQLDTYFGNLYLRERLATEEQGTIYEQSLQILAAGAERYHTYRDWVED